MKRFQKILFVIPPGTEQGGYTPSPMGLLYLAAYLRQQIPKIKVRVVDGALDGEEVLSNAVTSFKPDLVGVTVMTPGRHQALKVSRMVKSLRPRCKVVLGGIHPTLMWKQMMEHYPEIDFIVRGEGEIVLYELVSGKPFDQIKGLVWRGRGGVVDNPIQTLIQDIDSLPIPAWDLIEPNKYPARGEGVMNGIDISKEVRFSIIFSRGCMAHCTFCSSWRVWLGYRNRSGKKVADEVELLVRNYNARHFCFYDDTLTGNREEFINFCKEILKRKIKIALVGTTRVDKVDRQLLRWMKRAGFYELGYGIESGSEKLLLHINKRTNLQKIKLAMNLTKKAGIRAVALMMNGLPRETEEDRILTDNLLKNIRPDGIGSLGEVWIFPGTSLCEQAKHAGLIDDRFWLGKKPYYIYRGGIADDPINWKLQLYDELRFHFSGTLLHRMGLKILHVRDWIS